MFVFMGWRPMATVKFEHEPNHLKYNSHLGLVRVTFVLINTLVVNDILEYGHGVPSIAAMVTIRN